MRKILMVLVMLSGIVTVLYSQTPPNMLGVWMVENQFKNNLDTWYLGNGAGLSIFGGDGKIKPLESMEFRDDGMSVFTLKGGEQVKAFYRIDTNGYYVQPQGGKDTTIFFQPIAGQMILTCFTWRYPAGSIENLILILSKCK